VFRLDQSLGSLNVQLMLDDTLYSLDRLPGARAAALKVLGDDDLRAIAAMKDAVASRVLPEECYIQVKGRDPAKREV
jgi:hypothetical protein